MSESLEDRLEEAWMAGEISHAKACEILGEADGGRW